MESVTKVRCDDAGRASFWSGMVDPAAAPDSKAAGAKRGLRFPLSALILRYFFYVLAVTIALALCVYIAFGLLLETGVAYPANYGDTMLAETSERLAPLGSNDVEAIDGAVPSSFRWAVFAADGAYVAGDASESTQEAMHAAAFDGLSVEYGALSTTRYDPVELADGSVCVLMHDYLPQFVSKEVRDALPNPQNLLLALFALLSLVALVGIAARASHVLQRKMDPLVRAAGRIEDRDLDFDVGSSNVKEIDMVLAAMERMRSSLEESLDARWRSERRQRDQVAALAHDLKTPLTVVRGNLDMLLEEDLGVEARACAIDAAAGCTQMQRMLTALLEVSVAADDQDKDGRIRSKLALRPFAADMCRQAEALAATGRVRLSYNERALPESVPGDEELLARAVMNLVANAVDHAPADSTVELSFTVEDPAAPAYDEPADEYGGNGGAGGSVQVEGSAVRTHGASDSAMLSIRVRDEGPGFSAQALVHAVERFWRGDSARTVGDHSGLGLSIAASIAQRHGGRLDLANREDGTGACATLRIPFV